MNVVHGVGFSFNIDLKNTYLELCSAHAWDLLRQCKLVHCG
jgi:hypothetical protein